MFAQEHDNVNRNRERVKRARNAATCGGDIEHGRKYGNAARVGGFLVSKTCLIKSHRAISRA